MQTLAVVVHRNARAEKAGEWRAVRTYYFAYSQALRYSKEYN